ncbi:MAG: DUF58 domain-containing protein [Pseudomonadota bacterium]|uniref:Uncharacterized protein (DUF58 family) n=1 Tax=Gallaecimonas pentaromativorans TaxID=584787 RepID=A0A3N1P8D8_9GAMM|nr:DUF58 domain-containing protein [Gallaecimonas pentaromativorans]MED5526863.1 DUF58 domain-containing protein [Pseudomonadota bacterium]ROQ23327.1 uncharacterized protein (DUF58 family) [Gallaecimonas pentaromativorans]
MTGWRQWLLARFLAKRQPAASQCRLGNANIYILPTAFGYAFLALVMAIFLLGTNYQNNLVLLLAFFLISLFTTSMYFTHRNLAGLTLHRLALEPQVAGDDLRLDLQADGKGHWGLEFCYGQGPVRKSDVDGLKRLVLLAPPGVRGRHRPGRLTVACRFPLGLFRAWSYPDLDQELLLYPRPEPWQRGLGVDLDKGAVQGQHHGEDDWQGLKNYQPGDPLKRVAWKQLAQGRGMWSKEFARPEQDSRWLRLSEIKGATLEQRLARLAWLVLDSDQRQAQYGLDLGGVKINLGSGHGHCRRCLEALACYGEPA